MDMFKEKKLLFLSKLIFFLFLSNASFADINFDNLKNKKVSYLDFFLLKYESAVMRKAGILANQLFVTRVQYSNIGVRVKYFKKKGEIHTELYAIMDRNRYSKKKYSQKISDCNQVRNLMFYTKTGYTLFKQKRDPNLSTDIMEDLFKKNFFQNVSFTEEEIDFLLNKMFIKVIIFHPINKTELYCSGKINDYELK